jgi:hypothetical protein
LEKKITKAEQNRDPFCEGDMPMTEESLATSNKLSLPLDGMWKRKNKVTPLDEGSHGPYVGYIDEGACSQFQSKPKTEKDIAPLLEGETLEVVLQKWEVAIKVGDEARMQLDSLQGTLGMGQHKPRSAEKSSWLGLVHRFNDKENMVFSAFWALRGHATTLVQGRKVVHPSLKRLKTISERCIGGPTKLTTWGDIDHMFQHTNHYTKDRSKDIVVHIHIVPR